MDITAFIVSGLGSMFAYFLVEYVLNFSQKYILKPKQVFPYGKKLAELTSNLVNASEEVDRVLTEISAVATNREDTIKKLELNLSSLEKKETDLKQKIKTLEKLPIPVAEHFTKLMESGEKRSARRDYLLFGAGVAVSTMIAIVLKISGVG
jgi:hypothetical protein